MPRVKNTSAGRDVSKRRESRAKRAHKATKSQSTLVSRRRRRKTRSTVSMSRRGTPLIPDVDTLTRVPLATSRGTSLHTETSPHSEGEDDGGVRGASSESLTRQPISVSSRSRTPSDASIVDLTNDSGVEDEGVVDLTSFQMPAVGTSIPVSSGHSVCPVVGDGLVGGATSRDVIVIPESDDDVLFVSSSGSRPFPANSNPPTQTSTSMPLTLPSTPSNSSPHPSSSAAASPANSSGTSSIICPICMNCASQFERLHRKLVTTNCGHIFCDVCIRQAISAAHKCPMCNKRLTLRSYHPLYIT